MRPGVSLFVTAEERPKDYKTLVGRLKAPTIIGGIRSHVGLFACGSH